MTGTDFKPVFTIEGIPLYHGTLAPLKLTLQPQQIAALCGTNQAVFQSLLHLLLTSGTQAVGHIFLHGAHLPAEVWKRVRGGLSITSQEERVFLQLTVRQNLDLVYHRHSRAKYNEILNRIWNLFPQLKTCENRNAGTLSGGEQQMLAWARVILAAPSVVIFEDPWLGLAPAIIQQLATEIRVLAASGSAFLFFEDTEEKALTHVDYIYSF